MSRVVRIPRNREDGKRGAVYGLMNRERREGGRGEYWDGMGWGGRSHEGREGVRREQENEWGEEKVGGEYV